MIIICVMTNKSNINDEKQDGEYESLQMLRSKTDAPPFVRIFAELNRGDTHRIHII